MAIPGFGAEAAVYRSVNNYQWVGRPAAVTPIGISAVQPAAAIYIDGRFVCYGELGPFGVPQCYPPAGGGERCRPQCTPCRTAPDMPGRWRFCLRPDCDLVEVPCR
jgi:hypothetical protein